MIAKAIRDLAQFSDSDFFEVVSKGLDFALTNSQTLWRQAEMLIRAKCLQGAEILASFAEEEAAKFQILLDAVRCTESNPQLKRQLGYFNDHVAKGIYARHYEYKPATFGEVRRYVANMRFEFYLDGPEGFEWIFRNSILEHREQSIYVDFVRSEDQRYWVTPATRFEHGLVPLGRKPDVLIISEALAQAGVSRPDSLRVVAEEWRTFTPIDNTHWAQIHKKNRATIEKLQERELLNEASENWIATIVDGWNFPLCSLELGIDKSTTLRDLEEAQERASQDWEAREYGDSPSEG